jgi:hypothetical protein
VRGSRQIIGNPLRSLGSLENQPGRSSSLIHAISIQPKVAEARTRRIAERPDPKESALFND